MTCSHGFDPGYALEKNKETKQLKPEYSSEAGIQNKILELGHAVR